MKIELKKDFVDDANHFKGDFQDAAKKVQSDKWHNCASQLKGIAENLRMQEIAATLYTLTQTEDPEQAEKSIHQLYSYVDQL